VRTAWEKFLLGAVVLLLRARSRSLVQVWACRNENNLTNFVKRAIMKARKSCATRLVPVHVKGHTRRVKKVESVRVSRRNPEGKRTVVMQKMVPGYKRMHCASTKRHGIMSRREQREVNKEMKRMSMALKAAV